MRCFAHAGLAILGLWLLAPSALGHADPTPIPGGPATPPVVRLAELEIDPLFVDQYRAALRDEIETSIDVEPGVLSLNAVSIKGDPTRIRIFETYADMDAYYSHIQSPHFLKYKSGTAHMIRNLTVLETDTILLGSRP